MTAARAALAVLALAFGLGSAEAQVPTLKVTDRATTKTYTLRELLDKHRLSDVTVEDRLYGKSMSYRAVPMAELLKDLRLGDDDYVKATAPDNITVLIPVRLLRPPQPTGAEAFLALEDPAKKWPAPPKDTDKDTLAPFYLVWRVAAPAHVSREYWTDLKDLAVADNPVKKWPGLDVAATVPPADKIRTGLDRYVALCLTCHKVNGIGGSGAAAGTDLASPKNVTELMDVATIKKFVRNPKGVRPDSKMPKFDEVALSDDDLDALIAYLASLKR